MEISEATMGIFYMGRILGLAPYTLNRSNPKGGGIQFKRNIIVVVYSVFLISVLVTLTYHGLFFDSNSKTPVRMKSATTKAVTAMDVSVVVFVGLSGVICGVLGLKRTENLNRRLKKIDEILSPYANPVKDKIRAYVMMSAVLGLISIMLAFDIWNWMKIAQRIETDDWDPQRNVRWYIPFYSLYFILSHIHVMFAQSAIAIGRRYRRLNLALRNSFLDGDAKHNGGPNPVTIVKTITSKLSSPEKLKKSSSNSLEPASIINGMYSGKNAALILRLAYTHDSLGRAIKDVSGAFGLTVLFMLISCLLHLVATAYFLFLGVFGSKDSSFSWLQLLWILFHVLRLIMVVEPCHVTTEEAKKTIKIVCEIQRNFSDPTFSNIMTKFWQQLLSDGPFFSACGLCRIDRQILTTFSGAIATYLVILIQFQNTDS